MICSFRLAALALASPACAVAQSVAPPMPVPQRPVVARAAPPAAPAAGVPLAATPVLPPAPAPMPTAPATPPAAAEPPKA